MIQKRETCLYCGAKMESVTAKKKFCSNLHRLYYHRELKRGTLHLPRIGDKIAGLEVTDKQTHNNTTTITVQPMPIEKQKQERILQLEKELKNPPGSFTSSIMKKMYFATRKKELEQLQ